MSQSVPPNREPEATPVGHSGIRVEIQERRAWAISGWFGVLVVAGCIVGAYFLANSSVKGVIAAPIVVATVILGSLVIVQPGQTKVRGIHGLCRGASEWRATAGGFTKRSFLKRY